MIKFVVIWRKNIFFSVVAKVLMIWDCSQVLCQIEDDQCPLPKKKKSKKLVWMTLKNLPLQLIVRKHRRQPRILTYRKLISWLEMQQLTGSVRMNLYLLKVVEWLGHPLNKKVSKFFKKVYAKILKIFFPSLMLFSNRNIFWSKIILYSFRL